MSVFYIQIFNFNPFHTIFLSDPLFHAPVIGYLALKEYNKNAFAALLVVNLKSVCISRKK